MKSTKVLEKSKIDSTNTVYKSNYKALDFYGFLKSVVIPKEKLEKELNKSKKLLKF